MRCIKGNVPDMLDRSFCMPWPGNKAARTKYFGSAEKLIRQPPVFFSLAYTCFINIKDALGFWLCQPVQHLSERQQTIGKGCSFCQPECVPDGRQACKSEQQRHRWHEDNELTQCTAKQLTKPLPRPDAGSTSASAPSRSSVQRCPPSAAMPQ